MFRRKRKVNPVYSKHAYIAREGAMARRQETETLPAAGGEPCQVCGCLEDECVLLYGS